MSRAVIEGKVGLETKGVDVKLQGLQQRTQAFASRFGGAGGRLGSSFAAGFAKYGKAGIIAAVVAALAALPALIARPFVAAYAKIETLTTQFRVLFQDVQQAKAHLMDLRDFAAKTPFQLHGIAEASRNLYNFTDGALGGRESLTLVGDAAAATGNQIENVAMWIGRAYGDIQNGRPFAQAARRLQEMGIMTASTRNRLEEMQRTGASGAEVWRVMTEELRRYEGGMELLSQTIDGKSSTIRDSWQNMLAGMGEMFAPIWKRIQDMIINVLDGITSAIQRTHQFFRTIRLWQDSDLSWAEARAQAERELQELMEQRKQDQMDMQEDPNRVNDAELARLEAERRAMESESERLRRERAEILKEKLQADTRLQRIGAGGRMQQRMQEAQQNMLGGASTAFSNQRDAETRLLRDQLLVQQNTLRTLQQQAGTFNDIRRNTADWGVT